MNDKNKVTIHKQYNTEIKEPFIVPPLINILIRHKEGREDQLERCLISINRQSYDFNNTNIIVSNEPRAPFLYWPSIKEIEVPLQHYNLHCNDLKAQVKDGWFFFLDDDDYLASPTVLEELSHHLFEGALIVQFIRKRRREYPGLGSNIKKPTDQMIRNKIIKRGMIGGGCLVLHHSFKDVADWKAKPAADYDWIKEVTDKVPTRFVPLVLQIADVKNNGK